MTPELVIRQASFYANTAAEVSARAPAWAALEPEQRADLADALDEAWEYRERVLERPSPPDRALMLILRGDMALLRHGTAIAEHLRRGSYVQDVGEYFTRLLGTCPELALQASHGLEPSRPRRPRTVTMVGASSLDAAHAPSSLSLAA